MFTTSTKIKLLWYSSLFLVLLIVESRKIFHQNSFAVLICSHLFSHAIHCVLDHPFTRVISKLLALYQVSFYIPSSFFLISRRPNIIFSPFYKGSLESRWSFPISLQSKHYFLQSPVLLFFCNPHLESVCSWSDHSSSSDSTSKGSLWTAQSPGSGRGQHIPLKCSCVTETLTHFSSCSLIYQPHSKDNWERDAYFHHCSLLHTTQIRRPVCSLRKARNKTKEIVTRT